MKKALPHLSQFLIRTIWLASIVGGLTRIALAEDLASQSAISDTQVAGKSIADGSRIELPNVAISIVPPAGWEVITSNPSLTLVTQEPAAEKIEYNKAIYQRNITVAAVQQPAPIDELRATKLKEELMTSFGKEGVVKDYQVIEHKFFDYRGKNDGLIVFAQFASGEFSLMQMHVLVSGSERQFLMTYTDLADRFSTPETYEKAWNAMQSLEVTGLAPNRYENLYMGLAIAAACLLLLVGFSMMRRRNRRSYMDDADEAIYSDAPADFSRASKSGRSKVADIDFPVTQTGIWNLSSANDNPFVGEAKQHSRAKGEGFSFVTGF